MKSIEKRFWEKVKKTDSCWIWKGSVGNSGYGHFWINGKYTDAHRMSFYLTFGEIPGGAYILHECDNKICVNPKHLKIGDQSQNMKDFYRKYPHPISPKFTHKGYHHSAETKARLSLLAKGNKRCLGRSLSINTQRDEKGRFIKKLDGMMALVPGLAAARSEGEPSVTIRRI